MDIDTLLLKREELPILFDRSFYVPIHPSLLDPSISIDESLAHKVFPEAAKQWRSDLEAYCATPGDDENKTWFRSAFLDGRMKYKKEKTRQTVGIIWEDRVITMDNGFAQSLSINRNHGGTLFYNPSMHQHTTVIPFGGGRFFTMSDEKAKAYAKELREGENYAEVFIYLQHNIDHYAGALFLRNWAILYVNEALKQVLGSKR